MVKLFMGWCTCFGLISLIFVPMILFSTLNPIAKNNFITGGEVEMGMIIKNAGIGENYF